MRPIWLGLGLAVLAAVWVWPLPWLDGPPFASHMAGHMGIVGIAAPLLAWGLAGGPLDPVVRAPGWSSAIAASLVELVAVWAWHAPVLHHAARHQAGAYVLEQATFLLAGLALWTAAIGGSPAARRERAIPGIGGLLFTSMHMTLLGALLAFARRPLYAHPHGSWPPELDQQAGGVIMLLVGGAVYLAGGLALIGELLVPSERRP